MCFMYVVGEGGDVFFWIVVFGGWFFFCCGEYG